MGARHLAGGGPGVGTTEAPRGALAHWIVIKDKKIENYQLVVPSTWNASPRDAKGQRSAYEASLIGTPVHDPKQPLEIIRTIHSFDPCLACAVHLYEDDKEVGPARTGGALNRRRAMKPQRNFIRVYVWELPVRLTHWINAACIVVLGVSGYLIAHPPGYMTATEASFGYWFGIVRFTHFVAAYVFVTALVARVYWAFVGNKFAGWKSFVLV